MIHPFEGILGCSPNEDETGRQHGLTRRDALKRTLAFGCGASLLGTACSALAQNTTQPIQEEGGGFNNGFNFNNVGGIRVDAQGTLSEALTDDQVRVARHIAATMEDVPQDLKTRSEFRKVSLRRLQETVLSDLDQRNKVSDQANYLGGLQRIQYVFVYPEQNDIVLAGPAEPWRASEQGNVVGAESRLPVLLLDDLIVAIRSAEQAARGAISCSINPTAEGIRRLRAITKQLKTITDPKATARSLEEAMGKQDITLTNVPTDTSFARELVAADYRMKRLAMGFDPAPVRNLPSYLQMHRSGGGPQNVMPRWWLEPAYDAVLRDEENLGWELRGSAVECKTESDLVTDDGQVKQGVRVDPVARRWAQMMSTSYAELAARQAVFGHLQNLFDLAVVGAILAKHRLPERAGLDLSRLLDPLRVPIGQYNVPRYIDSKASLLKTRKNWVISVSGGVLLNSWGIAAGSRVSKDLDPLRGGAKPPAEDSWRWG